MFLHLEESYEDLVRDIREQTISRSVKLPSPLRAKLNERLRREGPREAANRADELEEVFSNGFHDVAIRIWPHLQVVVTKTTGTMEVYAHTLKEHYCISVPIYSPAYTSTEGLLGINLSPDAEVVARLSSSYHVKNLTASHRFVW